MYDRLVLFPHNEVQDFLGLALVFFLVPALSIFLPLVLLFPHNMVVDSLGRFLVNFLFLLFLHDRVLDFLGL